MNASSAWYSAIRSRDPRFDGVFYFAVVTTGIYCRPVCPAKPARPENIRYFQSAAHARDAGFRACRRCCPDSLDQTKANNALPSMILRAMDAIESGYLDQYTVARLAEHLGTSERSLRRQFGEILGTSPLAFAQLRRLRYAMTLVENSKLSMTKIAWSAGFSSLRRFNDAFFRMYHAPPSSFRKGESMSRPVREASFQIELPLRYPDQVRAVFDFLNQRQVAGLEEVDGTTMRRMLRVGDEYGVATICIPTNSARLHVQIPSNLVLYIRQILPQLQRVFDLHANLEEIERAFQEDLRLRTILERGGLGLVPGAWDEFELMVRAIIGQRISVAAATHLVTRLVGQLGEVVEQKDGETTWRMFPRPKKVTSASLEGIGLSRAAIATIARISKMWSEKPETFRTQKPLQERINELCEIAGIGPWTAHYIAMRAYKEPDAFPSGDLVLRKVWGNGSACDEKELMEAAKAWRPWRAYAAIAMWRNAAISHREQRKGTG